MTRRFWRAAAVDYYDDACHPRTAILRVLSANLLRSWLAQATLDSEAPLLDVGSGRSLGIDVTAARIVAVDWSAEMLSPIDRSGRVIYLLGDAEQLPVASGTINVVVASLGGPFNTAAFWSESRRVLRPGGAAAMTTPSYHWAIADRTPSIGEDDIDHTAVWEGRGGNRSFTSIVMPDDRQVEMVESVGFRLRHVDRDRFEGAPGGEVTLFAFEAA